MKPELISTLRTMMSSFDNAAFVLEGSFPPNLDPLVVTARRRTQEAADAVFLLLEALEKQNATQIPHR